MKRVNNGHRWTQDEFKRLIGYWLEGKELDEIAAIFKCTGKGINAMVGRLRREGIPLPRRTKGHRAGRSNTPWTSEEVEYLVRRRNEQITAEQIGNELGRSFLAVQAMIRVLRAEGVPVKMLGQGVRRLWNPEALKAAIAGRGL